MFKKLSALSCVFGFAYLVGASASAQDPMEFCTGFASDNGVSDEPCACIVEELSGETALLEEWFSLTTMDAYTSQASDELRAKVDPCVPADVLQ